MNKITVKEFVEGYINCTDSLKKRYIQEKLKVGVHCDFGIQ